ncbi:sugar phosphate isomerase/epimerase family protein [Chitinophaga rhizophila]|nr:sugar phosphate isomerase/epimerase family protein [Chitinophaga rhizophila]
MTDKTNRRQFLGNAALLAGSMLLPDVLLAAVKKAPRYRIAVCDWMILKRQKLSAFQLTKDIGADGLEVDMGGLGNRPTFDSKLSDPAVRQQFLDASRDLNVAISSIAMSGFYAQSFAERPEYEKMVQDCIDTMVQMNVKVAFLPLGVQGDLVKQPELRPAIVQRLKTVAAHAEKAGVIIGVETALPAKEEVKLLDEVGSPAVKSYFNFSNALQAGRDLIQELKTLGAKRICQIHCTDTDGVWLQNNPRIDMKAVKKTLDKMRWSGWLVIERSRDANDPRNVKKNFSANTAYLKSVFQ